MTRNSIIFENELRELSDKGLRRSLKEISGPQGREIILEGRKVLNFCSNNYLGLADDPRIVEAACSSLKSEGFGSGASRLVCGNMESHRSLQEAVAKLKKTEQCLLFSSGYMANVGIISGLFGRDDLIISDKLNHASIVDGIILSRADSKRYAHKDMDALEDILKNTGKYRRKLIVTDSVFSMDGDLAPLQEIVSLSNKYDALVMVDEAHAFGVLGENGSGLVEQLGLHGQIDIQMGTFSKAAGTYGAYCCGSKAMIDLLVNRARSFIYTTGLPPSVAAASLEAVRIIESDRTLRQKLAQQAQYLREGLKQLGFDTMASQTPIIPVLLKDAAIAMEFSRRLLECGIFVQAIRPPTVPVNSSRLRITVMATHVKEDIEYLLELMQKIGRDLAVI